MDHAKPYDLDLDNLGTVIQLITMFVAVVLLKEGLKELPLLCTMYFEAFGLTVVAKEASEALRHPSSSTKLSSERRFIVTLRGTSSGGMLIDRVLIRNNLESDPPVLQPTKPAGHCG